MLAPVRQLGVWFLLCVVGWRMACTQPPTVLNSPECLTLSQLAHQGSLTWCLGPLTQACKLGVCSAYADILQMVMRLRQVRKRFDALKDKKYQAEPLDTVADGVFRAQLGPLCCTCSTHLFPPASRHNRPL